MCGIAGYVGKHPPADLSRTLQVLSHRGPDAEGVWQSGDVTLMHKRLRIVDLSEGGRQPMTRGAQTVVFNGEIYNFLELRRVLEAENIPSSSNSDTEAILLSYQRWGGDFVRRLHGMFAFALWDEDRRELLLARDRIGKKPLFYHFDGQSLVFASEIKAVLTLLGHTPSIDYKSLDDYLTYLYIPYPRTIFSGIRQLPPATWMKIQVGESGLRMETGTFWDALNAPQLPTSISTDDLSSYVQDLVSETVRSRLVSDVPLGVLLSGGVDSSSITGMMARSSTEPVRSFSIGFPQNKNYDEIPYAQLVAEHFKCRHEVLEAEPSCADHLAKIVWHFDQPFGNPTAILTYILSELTRQSVTVALAGDGGDEVFGGYPRYVGAYLSGVPRALPGFIRNTLFPWIGGNISDDADGRHQFRRIREFLEDSGMPLIEMYLKWIGYFSDSDKQALYTPSMKARVQEHDSGEFLRALFQESDGLDPLNRLAYVDVKSFLCCNVLEYADRMSMAHALELRAPFTDHRLIEFSLRLGFDKKFRFGESKWILRKAMSPFLPPTVLNKRKLGFNPPVGTWLRDELRGLPEHLLSAESVRKRGFFEPEVISELLDLQRSGRRDYSLRIWALIVLEIWCRMYLDGTSVAQVQEEINEATAGRKGCITC